MTVSRTNDHGLQLTGKVFTSRYQNAAAIAASGAAPVRVTLGHPRFKLGYELAGTIMALAPRREHFRLEGEAFRTVYCEHLASLGIEHILGLLTDANANTGNQGLVLLCFENVLAGASCHRRMLAEWIQAESGLVVPELEAKTGAE